MIRADTRFRVREKKKLFGNEYRTLSEMAVTRLRTEDVRRFRPGETIRTGEIFTDAMGGSDPGFWGSYNTLIPEENLKDAIERFSSAMDSSLIKY